MEMPKWLKWVLGVVVFIAATVGAVWLAGFFFFAFSKTNPFGKTDFSTWWTYWQFYQADPVIAKRLKVSGIVAAVVAYVRGGLRCPHRGTDCRYARSAFAAW